MKKLIIMVPCYNCERQAVRVAFAIDDFLSKSKSCDFKIDKIFFVDNRSTDQTVSELNRAIPKLENSSFFCVAQNEVNYGLGGTHKSIFDYALKNVIDFVAVVHGDNQSNARELETLLRLSAQNNFATILGSRFSRGSQLLNYSKSRSWGNVLLNQVYSFVLKRKIEDLGSGLNVFNMRCFEDRAFLQFDDHFTFNMDVLIHLIANQHDILFAPISWKTEDEVSNALSWKVGSASLVKILSWRLKKDDIWRQQNTRSTYKFSVLYDG